MATAPRCAARRREGATRPRSLYADRGRQAQEPRVALESVAPGETFLQRRRLEQRPINGGLRLRCRRSLQRHAARPQARTSRVAGGRLRARCAARQGYLEPLALVDRRGNCRPLRPQADSEVSAMASEIVVGIETHTQLLTKSKMFSGASNAFGAAPNTQASAVDIALPGTLPVANRAAIEHAIRFGLAVEAAKSARARSSRARTTSTPTCPKGYQISQYEIPVVQGGAVRFCRRRGREIDSPDARAPRRGRAASPCTRTSTA